MDASEWDTRYSSAAAVWTRNANRTLVERCPAPGPDRRAMDLGCGEGGDTRWLAGLGWDVTGVDFSAVAIERARALAADLPEPRPHYVVADATQEEQLRELSPDGRFALITACYLHPEPEDRTRTYAHLPGLITEGGHLFILNHHPDQLSHGHDHHSRQRHAETGGHQAEHPPDRVDAGPFGPAAPRLLTPEDVLAALDVGFEMEVVTAEVIVRPEFDGDRPGAVDSLVVLRRLLRSSPAH